MLLLALLSCGDKDTAAQTERLPGGTVAGSESCTDGICEIPSGKFWMGIDDDAVFDAPLHQVALSAYAIDQTEVVRADWTRCVEAGVCEAIPPHCDQAEEDVDPDQLPVVCISWQQASSYCTWTGGRLPTEAEWEKAARGDDGALWAWGPVPPTCNTANHRFPPAYCETGPLVVGSYSGTSAYGLYDTVGNVWEWTADWYDFVYYKEAPDGDPPGPSGEDCAETIDGIEMTCRFRVMRGGAYNTTESNTRAAVRSPVLPHVFDVNIGVRCAYDR